MKEPQGIAFFNIKSGDTHYCKLEPQIQAYINSSNMGINASRDQDFGWRLAPEWVEKIRDFKKDEARMERLSARSGGQNITDPQILYAIYGEQVRAYEQQAQDDDNKFEEQYLDNISTKKPAKTTSEEEAPKEPKSK